MYDKVTCLLDRKIQEAQRTPVALKSENHDKYKQHLKDSSSVKCDRKRQLGLVKVRKSWSPGLQLLYYLHS